MADVSVRFQVAGDAEVVLNLSLSQAMRLMEAITRKVGETMAAAGQSGAIGMNGMGQPGMAQNGMAQNGMAQNGMAQNGMQQNGMGQNGMGGQGGLGPIGMGGQTGTSGRPMVGPGWTDQPIGADRRRPG